MKKNNRPSLLESITVLDLTNNEAGFCSRVLADLGARVIRVEGKTGEKPEKTVEKPLRDISTQANPVLPVILSAAKTGILLEN